MPIARNYRLKPLKEFAATVGAKITIEYARELSLAWYVLTDKRGDTIAREYDICDMLDAMAAYYGGHPDYGDARAQYDYMTAHLNPPIGQKPQL